MLIIKFRGLKKSLKKKIKIAYHPPSCITMVYTS